METEVTNVLKGEDVPRRAYRFPILSDRQIESLPDPKWLIDGILPAGGLVMLYGQPGAGKTFTALDMAHCIASGVPWQGYEVAPGATLYVVAEGVVGIAQRTRAWKARHGFRDIPRAHFLAMPVQLHQPEEVAEFLADALDQLPEPPVLIVFDTMARCFVGGDENGAKDAGTLVDGTEAIRKRTSATVLLVHHATKSGETERGSSALRGAMDTVMEIRTRSRGLTVTCEKQKNAREFDPIALRLVPHLESCVIERSRVDGLGSREIDALHALIGTNGGRGAKWREWQEASHLTESTFDRHRRALLDAGMVIQEADDYVPTPEGWTAAGMTPPAASLAGERGELSVEEANSAVRRPLSTLILPPSTN